MPAAQITLPIKKHFFIDLDERQFQHVGRVETRVTPGTATVQHQAWSCCRDPLHTHEPQTRDPWVRAGPAREVVVVQPPPDQQQYK